MTPLLALLAFSACSGGPGGKSDSDDSGTSADSGTTDDSGATNPDDDGTDGPAEECSGVTTAAPTWTRIDPMDDFSTRGLAYGDTYSSQVMGFSGVAYGDGRFLALGQTISWPELRWVTSRDGVTWTEHTQTLPGGATVGGVSRLWYQRDHFIAFTWSTAGQAWLLTSESGGAWTFTEMPTGHNPANVASSDDLTIVVGGNNDMIVSSDLQNWTPQSATSASISYSDIAYGDGLFITTVNGGGGAFSSRDGATWTPIAGIDGNPLIDHGDGTWLLKRTYDNSLWTSTDGATFTTRTPTGYIGTASIEWINGRFMGPQYVGSGFSMEASADGVTWGDFGAIPTYTSPDGAYVAYYPNAVACGQCTCVVAGLIQDNLPTGDSHTDALSMIAVGQVLPNE